MLLLLNIVPFGKELENALIDSLSCHDCSNEVAISIKTDTLRRCGGKVTTRNDVLAINLDPPVNSLVKRLHIRLTQISIHLGSPSCLHPFVLIHRHTSNRALGDSAWHTYQPAVYTLTEQAEVGILSICVFARPPLLEEPRWAIRVIRGQGLVFGSRFSLSASRITLGTASSRDLWPTAATDLADE
jgi:hypothetical protein